MANSLIEQGKKFSEFKNGISMFAIAGTFNTHASDERVRGLKEAVYRFSGKVNLKQVFPADWNQTIAKNITNQALKRYRDTRLIWAVNDSSAFGAIEAALENNLIPGVNTFFASCGWHPQSIDFIKQGKLTSSVGGHFMDGAWALIM